MNWTSFLTGMGVGGAGLFVVSYVFVLVTARHPTAPAAPHPLAADIRRMGDHLGELVAVAQASAPAVAAAVPAAAPAIAVAEAAVPVAEEVVHSLMQRSEG